MLFSTEKCQMFEMINKLKYPDLIIIETINMQNYYCQLKFLNKMEIIIVELW